MLSHCARADHHSKSAPVRGRRTPGWRRCSVRSPRDTSTRLRKAERMRYRPLGNSGLLVSVVGLGCNNFGGRLDVSQSKAVVDAAIDAGVTLLDTAENYS